MRRKKVSQKYHQNSIYLNQTGKTHGKATGRRRRKQRGGFLNRYDFAYAGRDVVNQAGKIAPELINQATGQINKIAQDRIDQIVRSGGAEVERLVPKIIRDTIEEVYKRTIQIIRKLWETTISKCEKKTI